jgi:glycosyltransferase involved in cell wall biosynthesis
MDNHIRDNDNHGRWENQPLVSIIMPVFNGEHCILDGINSVREQTYQNWELIVVDDGSVDKTWQLISYLSSVDNRIKPIKRTTENKGAASCRNIGLKLSSGEYVIFLDADDVLLSHAIGQRIDAMTRIPELHFGVFLQVIRSQDKSIDNKVFNIKEENRLELIKNFIQFKIPWQTTAPIWRVTFLQKLEGFNISYKRMEDPDLHIRALFSTPKFKCFYNLPFDCYYSVNFFNAKTGTDYRDFLVADSEIFFSTITSMLFFSSDFSNRDKRKYLSDGILYLTRFHLIRNYLKYRGTMCAIRNHLAKRKLISNGLKFKLFLLDLIYSRGEWGVVNTIAKKFVHKIVFYEIKKYVII